MCDEDDVWCDDCGAEVDPGTVLCDRCADVWDRADQAVQAEREDRR